MSYDPDEAAREEAEAEYVFEIGETAINEHSSDRLRSYYLAHPHLAKPGEQSLAQAGRLADAGFVGPALVSAVTAIEVFYKNCMVKPIVYGSVHRVSLAELVCGVALTQPGYLRYEDILNGICKEFLGRELKSFRVDGRTTTLWQDSEAVQRTRNFAVHRGDVPTQPDMELALKVATVVMHEIWAPLLQSLQLHQHPIDGRIITAMECSILGMPQMR